MNEFGTLLSAYRVEQRRSQASVASEAGMNPSYLQRLESGTRPPAKREVVTRLARALELEPRERARLYFAAGYAPPGIGGIVGECLEHIIAVVNDERIDGVSRVEFLYAVQELARGWGQRKQPRQRMKEYA